MVRFCGKDNEVLGIKYEVQSTKYEPRTMFSTTLQSVTDEVVGERDARTSGEFYFLLVTVNLHFFKYQSIVVHYLFFKTDSVGAYIENSYQVSKFYIREISWNKG